MLIYARWVELLSERRPIVPPGPRLRAFRRLDRILLSMVSHTRMIKALTIFSPYAPGGLPLLLWACRVALGLVSRTVLDVFQAEADFGRYFSEDELCSRFLLLALSVERFPV